MSGSLSPTVIGMLGPNSWQGNRPLFADAPVMRAEPSAPPQMPSSLAAAMMGRGGGMPMQPWNMPNAFQMAQMGQMLGQNGGGSSMLDGIGNLFSGYQWNGMPGQGMMNGLQSQAQGYVAGGAAGL